MKPPPAAGLRPSHVRADVCVVGAGLVGLFNALQYARRGLSVALLDEPTERSLADFKVGESLLVFSSAFLRTIGDLDAELKSSFVKQGFWMAYGMEGKEDFEAASEWGFLAQLPDRWRARVASPRLVDAMAGDVQIVRPEIEAALRERVAAARELITMVAGLARDVDLAGDPGPAGPKDHRITWTSRDGLASGVIEARWMVDCSGRKRWLASLLGHDVPLDDGFSTAAAWGQFADCPDEVFDERWTYCFPGGRMIRRDLDTVHLWGDGYWIWVIRLTQQRLSIGITFDRATLPDNPNLRDHFWDVLRRYPVLGFLDPAKLLQFHALRDVQYLSDTYVSPRRYVIAGDAASIIDAFYSQGVSLSLTSSWHGANIAQRDIRDGTLDARYIRQVNRATLADWRLLRSMVRGKYSPAIADSRFFLLDHLLDYTVLSAALLPRYRAARWLTETDGHPERETAAQARLRRKLRRTLYLTQCTPWHLLAPERVARIAERWHRGLERRARWRLEHGVRAPALKAVLRADAAIPLVLKLPFLRGHRERPVSLTPPVIVEPRFVRVKGTETSPPLLLAAGTVLLAVNLACLLFDVCDTGLRRAWHGLRSAVRGLSAGATSPRVPSPRERAAK
jgi:2-polyprenyl-6-methoxyphenol hydroxylase-like FAD-dependent oxidoreductase